MEEIKKQLQERFPAVESRDSVDWPAFNVPEERLLEVCRYLRDDLDYAMLVDVTAVDWSDVIPRFSVIYHLFSVSRSAYLRLAVNCADAGAPSMVSVCSIWPAANWHEREVYDMFGIQFKNHPDMRRILMWDDYPYFPLRKEFPLAGIETELPPEDTEVREATDAHVIAAPMMGGPFHATPGEPMSRAEPRAADQSWTEKNPKPLD